MTRVDVKPLFDAYAAANALLGAASVPMLTSRGQVPEQLLDDAIKDLEKAIETSDSASARKAAAKFLGLANTLKGAGGVVDRSQAAAFSEIKPAMEALEAAITAALSGTTAAAPIAPAPPASPEVTFEAAATKLSEAIANDPSLSALFQSAAYVTPELCPGLEAKMHVPYGPEFDAQKAVAEAKVIAWLKGNGFGSLVNSGRPNDNIYVIPSDGNVGL